MRFVVLFVMIFTSATVFAADWHLEDTTTVEIWTKHDLGYVADTVQCLGWWESGSRWYVRTNLEDGEKWSDKTPKILTRRDGK